MYYFLYKNIFSPFYETVIKRRKVLAHGAFLERSQWWPREKLLEFQWQELKKLLKHAYQKVPYWQDVFKKLNMTNEDIRSYVDFQRLPIITKDDIRNNKQRMIANNWQGKTWTKSTGGSTGVPLELDYTPDSYDWRMAVSKRGYGWAGCEDGMKQSYIWGTDIGNVPTMKKIKRDIHHALLRQQYFNCFTFTEDKMTTALKEINHFKPKIIIGYTNPLYNFAKHVSSSNKLTFHPQAAITAAEKLHDFQRAEIEKAFGCPVFNTYGSREFMLIASECAQHQGLHLSAENLFVEVISKNGLPAAFGEAGEIVITDLHNEGMPFMRYKIGDMGVLSDRTCPCGRGLPLLEDVVGRSLDMIRTPDGRFVPGEFFPHLMKEFKGVKQFQVIQESLQRLVIKLVKSAEFKESDFTFMRSEIIKVIGSNIEINFHFVDEIPLTQTGKYRVTVSYLKERN